MTKKSSATATKSRKSELRLKVEAYLEKNPGQNARAISEDIGIPVQKAHQILNDIKRAATGARRQKTTAKWTGNIMPPPLSELKEKPLTHKEIYNKHKKVLEENFPLAGDHTSLSVKLDRPAEIKILDHNGRVIGTATLFEDGIRFARANAKAKPTHTLKWDALVVLTQLRMS